MSYQRRHEVGGRKKKIESVRGLTLIAESEISKGEQKKTLDCLPDIKAIPDIRHDEGNKDEDEDKVRKTKVDVTCRRGASWPQKTAEPLPQPC